MTGRSHRTHEYDSPPDQIAALQRRIASEVADAIRTDYVSR